MNLASELIPRAGANALATARLAKNRRAGPLAITLSSNVTRPP